MRGERLLGGQAEGHELPQQKWQRMQGMLAMPYVGGMGVSGGSVELGEEHGIPETTHDTL